MVGYFILLQIFENVSLLVVFTFRFIPTGSALGKSEFWRTYSIPRNTVQRQSIQG